MQGAGGGEGPVGEGVPGMGKGREESVGIRRRLTEERNGERGRDYGHGVCFFVYACVIRGLLAELCSRGVFCFSPFLFAIVLCCSVV